VYKRQGLDGKGTAYFTAQYKSGKRDATFIQEYIKVLESAYLKKQAGVVVEEYFKTVDKLTIFTKANWDLFYNNISDVDSDMYKYVNSHKEKFYGIVDKRMVDGKLMGCWGQSARAKYLTKGDDGYKFDEKGLMLFAKRMKKAGVKDIEGIVFGVKHEAAFRLEDWNKFVKLAEGRAKKANGLVMYNWGLKVSKACKDMKLRLRTAKILEDGIKRFEEAEAKKKKAESGKSNVMMMMGGSSMSATYNKYLVELVEKLKKDN